MNRRELLGLTGVFIAGGATSALGAGKPYKTKPGLKVYDVKEYGAVGDGHSLDTRSINRAVDACHAAGGGIVYLSPGTYLSGTVLLLSNVTLYLEAGATLLGSKDLADYRLEPGPHAKGDANQKHLIFARDAENVGLAGPGRIDGQGSAFWVPSGRVAPPPKDSWKDVATYDWKPLDRPSPLLEFYNCRNLRLEQVRIENASGWTVRPIQCENVWITGITIKNPVIGPNTDGLDLTCSRNVFISDCLIDTGDDAICLKSESPYGGEPQISKNITITNCVLTCCCNGLKFGTATRGGFENVTFSNSVIYNDDVDLKSRVISGIALEIVDGGWMEGVVISNIRMQRVRTPIFIRRGNRTQRPDGTPGTLRGVRIENVHATEAILTSSVTGLPGFNVEDVSLSSICVETNEAGKAEWASRAVPELDKAYPEARMFGRLPAYGFYCRHVKGLRLRQIEFEVAAGEERPALVCEDVQDLDVEGLRGGTTQPDQPVIKLAQTRRAWIHGCSPPQGTGTFLAVSGSQSEQVVLSDNELTAAKMPVTSASDVSSNAVILSGNVTKA
jgi:polygalacturonase